MNSKDRELLVGFLASARSDLLFVFDVALPYLDPKVQEQLWPAWEALEHRREFEALRDAIESREYDARLDRVGLSGPELQYKLTGLEVARAAGREQRTPRLFKRWLKWLDVILGSLLSAIGIGEGIKELKEGVEAELEQHDES